jgi:hypothetical protein
MSDSEQQSDAPGDVPPPLVDDEFEVPEAKSTRSYSFMVADAMEMWSCSKPEAERRMTPYSLEQVEWLLRERWS